jgi:CHAT domain
MVTCILTIQDDYHGEYEDDLIHLRSKGAHVEGSLGGSRLTRDTVKLLNRWVATYDHCRRDELTILGRYLYAIAFGDTHSGGAPMRKAFEETYDAFTRMGSTPDPLRLRLVLSQQARELGRFPWEFLFMPRGDGGFFLAGEKTKLLLTRFIPNTDVTPDRWDEDASLNVLLVLSQPRSPGLGQVAADDLIKQVMDLQSDQITTRLLESPTRVMLRDEIANFSPHIVHFIGHGRAGAIALKKEEALLKEEHAAVVLSRSRGEDVAQPDEADWADSRSLCTLLRHGLDDDIGPGRLVFLHACHGATPSLSADSLEVFNSVARALAESERVAAVVAMQFEISNDDAQRFAKKFYVHIREGYRVDEAVNLARRELGEISTRGRQAWDDRSFGTPVIYLRSADPFFRRSGSERGRPAAVQPPVQPLAGKEDCPNPLCKGYVHRDRPPCRACRSYFVPCPRPLCKGLVVSAPGSWCSECDYRVEESRRPRDVSDQPSTWQAAPVQGDTADLGSDQSRRNLQVVSGSHYGGGRGAEWEGSGATS